METLKVLLFVSASLNILQAIGLIYTIIRLNNLNCTYFECRDLYPNLGKDKCGDATVWKDGKCQINFQEEDNLLKNSRIIDACNMYTPNVLGHATILDLEKYAARTGYLPKSFKYGYTNGEFKCRKDGK
jgi:hypothetical protein